MKHQGLLHSRRQAHPFPPRSCGGLIEATSTLATASTWWGLSPRVRAGASLKRAVILDNDSSASTFPPAFVRGPH